MIENLSNLNDIDLLPAEYRKRRAQRRTYVWRLLVILAFTAFFGSTALLQHNHHAYLRLKLVEVEGQYFEAVAHNAKSAEVKAQLQAVRSSAELLTYLRHPWPRTQIIAAILEPLTDSITLTDWHVARETIHRGAVANAAPRDESKAAHDKPARRARDLARLLHEHEEQQHFVLLAGHASEAAALHEYLARLGSSALFSKIDLKSMENVAVEKPSGSRGGSFHFTARAILKPGHGQLIPVNPAAPPVGVPSVPLALRQTARGVSP